MIIKNTVKTLFPLNTFFLNNNLIEVIPYFALNETEANKLNIVFDAIEYQIRQEGLSLQTIPKAQMFLTKDGHIEYSLEQGVLGECNPYWIVFPIQRWRDKQIQNNTLIIIMIEEMCHWIWQEFDEVKVKNKVIEIIRRIDCFKNATLENIFDMSTL